MNFPPFLKSFLRFKKSRFIFISSPFFSTDNESDTYDYFAYMVAKLSQEIEARFDNIDLIVKVPGGGSKISNVQSRLIRRAIKSKNEYSCIIINPYNRDELYKNVETWIKNFGEDKLFFIDQGYTLKKYRRFHDDRCSRPPYVQANWFEGGKIAGKSMANLFYSKGLTAPHIVILEGDVGSDERIQGFKLGIQEFKRPNFSISPAYSYCKGNYSKKQARDSFDVFFNDCLKSIRRIDGIFACNDEMALGVRDVLIKHAEAYCQILNISRREKEDLPQIIGFDGIKDMTLLIDNDHEFLYDTICVFPEKQVEKLVNIIEQIVVNGNSTLNTNDKYIEMPCESYRYKDTLV